MEVVIGGDLARVADGVGFRGWAMGGGKIAEHARLFEVPSITTLASGLVVWQLLTFAVGQKHLADLRRTLKRLEGKIDEIRDHLEGARIASIESDFEFIADVVKAGAHGAARLSGLERFDTIDQRLTSYQIHLFDQLRQVLEHPIEKGRFGTKTEWRSVSSKIERFTELINILLMCMDTRLACCYAASIFAKHDPMLELRVERIRESFRKLAKLRETFSRQVSDDLGAVRSRLDAVRVLGQTTRTRQKQIESERVRIKRFLNDAKQEKMQTLAAIQSVTEELRLPRRLWLQVSDGKVEKVYEAPMSLIEG